MSSRPLGMDSVDVLLFGVFLSWSALQRATNDNIILSDFLGLDLCRVFCTRKMRLRLLEFIDQAYVGVHAYLG